MAMSIKISCILLVCIAMKPKAFQQIDSITPHRIKQKDSLGTASHQLKQKAFQVLENKCNVCHKKRNKRRIFTPEKMNLWKKEVKEQVFIKKRMPMGRRNKLSEQEYQDILNWIQD